MNANNPIMGIEKIEKMDKLPEQVSEQGRELFRSGDELRERISDLKRIINERCAVKIEGRRYVTYEGWAMIAGVFGCHCYTREIKREYDAKGNLRSVTARVDVMRGGQIIGGSIGYVGSDEGYEKEFHAIGKAQTRGIGRACRSVFGGALKVLGKNYESTTAEEMENVGMSGKRNQPASKSNRKMEKIRNQLVIKRDKWIKVGCVNNAERDNAYNECEQAWKDEGAIGELTEKYQKLCDLFGGLQTELQGIVRRYLDEIGEDAFIGAIRKAYPHLKSNEEWLRNTVMEVGQKLTGETTTETLVTESEISLSESKKPVVSDSSHPPSESESSDISRQEGNDVREEEDPFSAHDEAGMSDYEDAEAPL